MSKIVMGLGGLFMLIGVWVLIAPEQLVDSVDWASRTGLYIAGGLRIFVGLILFLSAPSTRYPRTLRVVGGLVVVAGVGLMFMPMHWWAGLIHFWLVTNVEMYRFGGGAVGLVVGALLVHAGWPEQPAG